MATSNSAFGPWTKSHDNPIIRYDHFDWCAPNSIPARVDEAEPYVIDGKPQLLVKTICENFTALPMIFAPSGSADTWEPPYHLTQKQPVVLAPLTDGSLGFEQSRIYPGPDGFLHMSANDHDKVGRHPHFTKQKMAKRAYGNYLLQQMEEKRCQEQQERTTAPIGDVISNHEERASIVNAAKKREYARDLERQIQEKEQRKHHSRNEERRRGDAIRSNEDQRRRDEEGERGRRQREYARDLDRQIREKEQKKHHARNEERRRGDAARSNADRQRQSEEEERERKQREYARDLEQQIREKEQRKHHARNEERRRGNAARSNADRQRRSEEEERERRQREYARDLERQIQEKRAKEVDRQLVDPRRDRTDRSRDADIFSTVAEDEKKADYGNFLLRQIEEKKRRERKRQEEEKKYNKRLERDAEEYLARVERREGPGHLHRREKYHVKDRTSRLLRDGGISIIEPDKGNTSPPRRTRESEDVARNRRRQMGSTGFLFGGGGATGISASNSPRSPGHGHRKMRAYEQERQLERERKKAKEMKDSLDAQIKEKTRRKEVERQKKLELERLEALRIERERAEIDERRHDSSGVGERNRHNENKIVGDSVRYEPRDAVARSGHVNDSLFRGSQHSSQSRVPDTIVNFRVAAPSETLSIKTDRPSDGISDVYGDGSSNVAFPNHVRSVPSHANAAIEPILPGQNMAARGREIRMTPHRFAVAPPQTLATSHYHSPAATTDPHRSYDQIKELRGQMMEQNRLIGALQEAVKTQTSLAERHAQELTNVRIQSHNNARGRNGLLVSNSSYRPVQRDALERHAGGGERHATHDRAHRAVVGAYDNLMGELDNLVGSIRDRSRRVDETVRMAESPGIIAVATAHTDSNRRSPLTVAGTPVI
eukprot:g107.t1